SPAPRAGIIIGLPTWGSAALHPRLYAVAHYAGWALYTSVVGLMDNLPMNDKTRSSENKPLWGAEDQAARLVELTSDTPEVKEAPLRRDVRSLGRLLGEVLKEQAGDVLFNAVEEIRQLAIEYREMEPDIDGDDQNSRRATKLMERIAKNVGDMGLIEAYRMTKAFAIYF